MAPAKKPRTANKRFSSLNEVSPEKDEASTSKNKQRKKKLSDKLGSKWNKEELERFYVAYRKYGKDWKKVAAVVSNKSVEMVEALYNMNRAYLSLAEGVASVVGLIAMVTDHYNVLEESDSERESNDVPGSQKPMKQKRGKIQLSVSNDSVQSQSIASNVGCLSLLKKRQFDGSRPRAVGKRTPRLKIDDRENYFLPNKRNAKSVFDANDDKALEHLAALALIEAAQRGGSPQVSQKSYKRSKQKFSPVQSGQRMHQGSETVPAKFYDASIDQECLELEDESSSWDDLQTLADLSILIPISAMESESSFQLKGKKTTLDKDEKSALPEGTSTSQNRDKIKLSGFKQMVNHAVPGVGSSTKHRSRQKTILQRPFTPKEKSSENILNGTYQENRDKIKLPGLKQKVDHAVPGVGSSTKRRSNRKTILQRAFTPKEKSSENMLNGTYQEKLSGCLSSYMVRRWCMFEWFYSAIDYPWFSKRDFMEYLNHVDLGRIPRLTRVEWSVIKSALGNPRRFSEHFLHGERQKLKQYRESVRKHYNELWTGIRDGLPIDLAKPLCVGQRVIALHSKTREIHNGSVLTVDHDKYSVQFDHPELPVEFVMDIDCMPLNPLDNMPETLRWEIGAGNVPCMSEKLHMKGNSSFGGAMTRVSSGPVEKAPTSTSTLAKHKNVSNALLHLRKHNTYMRSSLPPRMNPKASFDIHDGHPSTMDGSLVQELGSTVVEIIKGSRLRAHAMVDAAFQALSSMKEGEDAFMRISQVLDCADYQQLATNSRLPVIGSQKQMSGSFDYHNRSIFCSSEPQPNDASEQKLHNDSDKVDTQIPSDLITCCVATWIMIQTCIEQQYPPADVVQILNSAVTSLRPCSPRNLAVYREIQKCMGRIKTQILAITPT